MTLSCGIVGMPNVGKSTLFNALTRSAQAQAANFPFCTIDPNVGEVAVPDARLQQIASIAKSARIIPARMTFVDIAGLIEGASTGEGLGNKFLANIREADALIHVLRCFEDKTVTHVNDRVDPLDDARIVETEMLLADLESLERRLPALRKKLTGSDKTDKPLLKAMEIALACLEDSKPVRTLIPEGIDTTMLARMQLLTAKPVLYLCNVAEEANAAQDRHCTALETGLKKDAHDANILRLCLRNEEAIALLESESERQEYMAMLAMEETGLDRLVAAAYKLLGLMNFFTAGPKESRAWTIRKGACAPEAAGVIHSDFERGFIRAETVAYPDFIAHEGFAGAKAAGKMTAQGRDYVVGDGDVMLFRFNN